LDRYLDEAVAHDTQETLESEGVEIHTNSVVTAIEDELDNEKAHKKKSHVFTRDGSEYVADGIIYATGFRPNSFLVADQVELGDKGAIVVDEFMHTSVPDVFAVGDCATTTLTNVKKPSYVPHASDAIRQGEVAAVNLFSPTVKLNKSQGTYKLNFNDEVSLCMTGLNLSKAKAERFDCEMVYVRDEYVNSPNYYELWLIYEKGTHKILGMQSKGSAPELASQADIISLAIQNEMTVNEIEYTDFYYKHGFKNPRSFTKLIADQIRRQEKASNQV
jgi:NADPH-dependent 2,4-dienoyl-CoA reductase/sulfur reductase-like enzyme